jgi:hypothetical protein
MAAASFDHRSLRGRSLIACDFIGTDFTGSDLRGANFAHANLRGAVLREVWTGLGPLAAAGYAALGVVLGVVTGFAASWTGAWIHSALHAPGPGLRVLGALLVATIVADAVATLWRGAPFALEHVAVPMFAIVVVAGLVVLLSGWGSPHDFGLAMTGAASIVVIASAIGVGAFARAVSLAAGRWLLLAVLVGTVVGVRLSNGLAVAVTVAVVATVMGLKARHRDVRAGVASFAFERVLTLGGTSFRNANLEGADFSGARVRNTDFRGANLVGARWGDALEIDFCRFDPGAPAPPPKPFKRTKRQPRAPDEAHPAGGHG